MSLGDSILFAILGSMGGAAIRATLLAGIAGVSIRLLRIQTPAARHAVWTAVTAGMLCLPFAPLVVPSISTPSILHVPERIVMLQSPPAIHTKRPNPIRIDITSSGMSSVSERVSTPVTRWAAVAVAAYGLGLLVFGGRLAAGLFVASRLAAKAVSLRGTEASRALTEVADKKQMPYPRPSLHESHALSAPVVISGQGLVLLLPTSWREWGSEKLRAVMLHELAHVQRADCLVMALAAVNRVVFWFHPLAWWLQRRVAELCEQASDDAAVSATGDAAGYAQVLLEIASATRTHGTRLMPGALAAPSMAGTSGVAKRIHRVLDAEQFGAGCIRTGRWYALAALTVVVVGVLAAAQVPGELKPPTGDVPASWKYIEEGFRVTPEQAQELEMRVSRQPDDLSARARLIAYYYYNARPKDMVRHAHFVIEHHPESQLAGSDLVVGAYAGLGLANPPRNEATENEWKQLWLRQAALHDSDARVLSSAGRALVDVDPLEAERMLLRALNIAPGDMRVKQSLAQLYARSIRADVYLSSGITLFVASRVSKAEFANHARSALETSGDTGVIGSTGVELARYVLQTRESARNLEAQLEMARQQVADAARVLLVRALGAEPGREEWLRTIRELDSGRWKMPLGLATPPTLSASPAAPAVSTVVPRQSPTPEYPALAREARIQGVVRFRLHVDSEGHVAKIEVTSGHPLLVPAAMESVRQYVYSPTGAEFQTAADVNFILPPR